MQPFMIYLSGGVIVGAVVQRNGYLNELGIVLPGQNYYYEDYGNFYDDGYFKTYQNYQK